MITRIIDNKPTMQKFDDNFLDENSGKIINGDLVDDWIMAPFPPINFIKPTWDGSNYIESATQEEINSHNQQLQLQAIENYKNKWKSDGQAYYDLMANRIIMMLAGKINAVPMMLEIKKTVNPMLEQIQRGNQSLAMLDYLDGENNPTIKEVIELFNEIGRYCQLYYQTEYPH